MSLCPQFFFYGDEKLLKELATAASGDYEIHSISRLVEVNPETDKTRVDGFIFQLSEQTSVAGENLLFDQIALAKKKFPNICMAMMGSEKKHFESLCPQQSKKLIDQFILLPLTSEQLRLNLLQTAKISGFLQKIFDLEVLAELDPVTQIPNKRILLNHLEQELKNAMDQHHQVALIVLDIDNFKLINDKFGHPEGDRILKDITSQVRDQVSGKVFVGKYGGEEIGLVLSRTTSSEIRELAERIREFVEKKEFACPLQRKVQVTLSIGVSCFPQNGTTLDALIAAADRALFQAKRQGRNQVVYATL